jgi:endoglucanase
LEVVARARRCNGSWPQIRVDVDGTTLIRNTIVDSSSWKTFRVSAPVVSGDHNVRITALNIAGCDRFLYADSVTFIGTSPTTPIPTVTLAANPTSITTGGSSTLSWNSTYADSCTASGAWQGSQPTSGSTSTGALSSQQAYTLTCTGPGGSASTSTTVYVDPVSSNNPLAVAVAGNSLVDGSGNPVQLRGVNRSGTQYACIEGWGLFDGPVDATSLSRIKDWGATAVRVSLNESCWLGINGAPTAYSGTNYQSAIASYVGRLNAQGLRVILDLHWNGPGTTKAVGQLPMADRDHAPAFWQSVANVFKNNPSVIFDLYNEPHPDGNRNTAAAWTCVRDGGTCPGVGFTAAGSQEMVNAIRGTGATNVIMVGGPQYAGVVDQWWTYRPTDPLNQLAASIHIYYNTPSNPEWAPCYRQSCWENSIAPLAQQVPIVIGEVGELDCGGGLISGTSLSPTQASLLDWSDQHGVSYLAWSWIANGGGNCSSEPSVVSDYNGTPTNYGKLIRDHLLGLPH